MNDADKQFRDENGMSLDEAVNMVQKWLSEGKTSEAQRGRDEILKFFPDHNIRNLFPEESEETPEQSENSPPLPSSKTENSKEEKKDFFSSAKTFIGKQSEKIREMSRPAPSEQTEIPQTKTVDENERLLGVFCYAWFFVLIPLFLRRDSAFIQFHAFQGVVLTAAFTAFDLLILGVLRIAFNFGFIDFRIKIVALGIYLVGASAAYHGKWLRIPIISGIAEKLRKMLASPTK